MFAWLDSLIGILRQSSLAQHWARDWRALGTRSMIRNKKHISDGERTQGRSYISLPLPELPLALIGHLGRSVWTVGGALWVVPLERVFS